MIELNDEQILHNLKHDTVGRNSQISVLINLLNSNTKSAVIAIDGMWGSGKTVFIKQLCMLADKSISAEEYSHASLDQDAIDKLRDTQKVFYFNAWSSDYLGDALSAILLKLIAEDDEGLNAAAINRVMKMIKPAEALKKMSQGAIDVNAETKKELLVKNIKDIVDRHEAVNNFLDRLKGDSQRIVFVIDELDRCKPSFAVDILEVMKHYFIRSDATFLIATNTKELAHTVQKYYGYNFDGYTYLNRFFDYTYHLNKINIEQYTQATLGWTFDGGMVSGVASDAINYFKFEMREINAYISALRLIENFFDNSRTYASDQMHDGLVKYLLVPLALALKIKNNGNFIEFANGTEKGVKILRDFAQSSEEIKDFARSIELKDVDITIGDQEILTLQISKLIEAYSSMFKGESARNSIGRYLRPFQSVISLLSSYTTVVSSEENDS